MTYGSLFTGIGGLDLGLDRAGFECRWQVEIDPYALKVLEKHWPNVTRYGDITKLDGNELEPVDLMCGGFPCQDLSQAGKQVGITGSRSGLWFEFARLVGILRPRYVLIENVPGLLIHDAMRRVIGELARLGYVGIWRSLRASEFGASHLRKRVFIVAYRDGERVQRLGGLLNGEWAALRDNANGCDIDLAHSSEGAGTLFDARAWNGRQDPGGRSDDVAYGNGERCGEAGELRPRQISMFGGFGNDVAYGPLRGLGELRQPSGGNGLVNGSHEELAYSSHQLHNGTGISGPGRRRQPANGHRTLADSLRTGLEVGDGKRELQIRGDTTTLAPGLPAFAPGPSSPLWPYILRERPDSKPCNEQLMRSVKRVQGTAAREPGQGARTTDSGAGGEASAQNSTFRVNPLFGAAKEEPNQGARTNDSGAGGTATTEGRGTMEQK